MKTMINSLFRSVTSLRSAAAGLLALGVVSAHGLTIEYQAINLADTQQGQDLWRYNYCVSGYNFQPDEFFDIFFGNDYGALSNPQPDPSSVWSASASDPLNPKPHIFDATALMASSGGLFSVDFVWLGAGTPGSQAFIAGRPGASPTAPAIIFAQGTTTGKVPEGGPGLLLTSLALGALINPFILRRLRNN